VNLPIRARLTAWYVVLLAAIIVGLAAFVILRFQADMQASIDSDLRRSAPAIADDYADEGLEDFPDSTAMVLPRGGFAQVLDSGGRLLASAGDPAPEQSVAPAAAWQDAVAGRSSILTSSVAGRSGRFRTLVRPVDRLGQRQVLVVAESMGEVDDAVRRMLVLLLLAGPAALAATAFGGWWLARQALLPVERMTSKAEQIGIDRLHERIAVPRAHDEIGHLALTLNAMLDRIEHGVADKQRLIADASHELRTPLAVMRAELDVTLRGDDLAEPERAVLESVRDEVDHMSRTVHNLLTLAQVDEGRLDLLISRVPLRRAVETAASQLTTLARTKRVRVEIDPGDPGDVDADPERLHQVLANLIDNAVKFTPPGGDVRITPWRRDGEAGVTVTDTGPGIPEEARPHLFDRFFRVDAARARTHGGSGLGLAICREIALAHGGRLWVDSEPGRGSAFSLALPAGPPSRVPRQSGS
jgi:heavy metal sensor kinase